jgi:hypothetical protein
MDDKLSFNTMNYFSYPIFRLVSAIVQLYDPKMKYAIIDHINEIHFHSVQLERTHRQKNSEYERIHSLFTTDISRFIDNIQINHYNTASTCT